MWLLFEAFKYLRSSMHGCLYICLRTVTLAVLFKCLESSMHMRLYMSLHVLKDCDTCCFVQVSRVIHAHASVHVFTRA